MEVYSREGTCVEAFARAYAFIAMSYRGFTPAVDCIASYFLSDAEGERRFVD